MSTTKERKQEITPVQNEKEAATDRLLKEAYELMYERKKFIKEADDKDGARKTLLNTTGELRSKIDELMRRGMTGGALGKLTDSLEDPGLTKY